MWSDVVIRTDKDVYKKGEIVVITARSEGYLFNPSIRRIELFGDSDGLYEVPDKTETSYFRVVHVIKSDSRVEDLETRPTYIGVSFQSQASPFVREEFHELTIIP